ncbi:MAG: hypothetical protein O7E54_10990 [Planctomycetota bacterium]|nr:hypothetical protein [Planctomycetota bacterium]
MLRPASGLDPLDPLTYGGRAAALRALGRFQGAAAAEQRAQQLGGAPGLRFRFVPGR